jgi:fructokinase
VWKHFVDTHKLPGDKVYIDTDVNVCALYGYQKAKAQGQVKESFCYITVGTGVGVGLIVNGSCVHGTLHPEGGHVFVPRDPREDPDFKGVCPFHEGCVEGMCSNIAIQKRLGLSSVEEVAGVPDSHVVWDIVGGYLGTMCSNIFLTTSCEMFMLGGGVFNRGCLIETTR